MKQSFLVTLLAFAFFTSFASCDKENLNSQKNGNNNSDTMSSKIIIKIGASTFTATLLDNATANTFKAMLPVTLNMTELNGNEKYFQFSSNLPVNASNPGTIFTGDLMLWGANSLVLFYKTFSTSYSYTKLGRIDDSSGVAAAVGSGNIIVTFELQ